jgi:GNAT superfamily N-acetyltransferase
MPLSEKDITLREMTREDIPLGMRLKSLAHWNQLEADWELLIRGGAGRNLVALYKGTAAGTATILSYQDRFSWIGMVLVDPAFRGLGIGTALLQEAIARAKSKGTVRLDATPQGQKLYETLGFETERELVRLERPAGSLLPRPNQTCAPVTAEVLPEIIELDAPVFGADRAMVLQHLFHQAPQYAFYVQQNGRTTGYCLGRPGSNFDQIGPVIAGNQEHARDLLLTALRACADKAVIVDAFAANPDWLAFLESLGFAVQRPLIRMHLGPITHSGNPEVQYAIAGPELG